MKKRSKLFAFFFLSIFFLTGCVKQSVHLLENDAFRADKTVYWGAEYEKYANKRTFNYYEFDLSKNRYSVYDGRNLRD